MAGLFRFQKHSYAYYLPDDVDLTYFEHGRPLLRGRVRQHHNPRIQNRAPAAQHATAVFQKIDRTVQFAAPASIQNAPPAFIDQYNAPRMQHRVHRRVFQTNETETVLAQIPAIQQAQSAFSPPPDDMAEK